MSTDAIIEILRSHDNPCAVLERHAPLFQPFDLAVAMHYARAHYSRTPRIYASLVLAALNAASDMSCWHLSTDYSSRIIDAQMWGLPHPAMHHAQMHINLARKSYRIQAFYFHDSADISEHLVLVVPLIDYSNVPPDPETPSEAQSHLFAHCVEEVLQQFGVCRYVHPRRFFKDRMLTLSQFLSIPLSQVTPSTRMLCELVQGDDIFARREGEFVPGPLAREMARKKGMSEEALMQWIRHDFKMFDDEIPF